MDILFYSPSDSPRPWVERIQRALPHARIRVWQPGDHAHADYAILWRPTPDVLRGRTSMRAIFNLGAGVDAILELAHAHPGALPPGVPIVRLEDSGMATQMAEYATYAVLRHMRRFDEYEALQSRREWQQIEPYARSEFAVAVLGLGQLGAHVARTLAGFGLPVRGFSRSPKSIEGVTTCHGEDGFVQCIAGARALINLLPNTPATLGILNRVTFSHLADNAIVINLARGPHLVDEDLLAALDSGKVGAAMLDVFHVEPLPPEHPFWRDPRVRVTPHVSALTLLDESIAQIAQKIEALERGEPISGVVDLGRGY
jgi:glyoxylate/hydroxypyruvate reductase